jgi:hypothetical protein
VKGKLTPTLQIQGLRDHILNARSPKVLHRRLLANGTWSILLELPLATGQSTADLAKTVCAAELAKQHSHDLPPARKSFGRVIGTMFFYGMFTINAWEQLQQLGENARKSLHGRSLLFRDFGGVLRGFAPGCIWPEAEISKIPGFYRAWWK